MPDPSLETSVARLFFELDGRQRHYVLRDVLHPRMAKSLSASPQDEQLAILRNFSTELLFATIDKYREPQTPSDYVYLIRAEESGRVKIGISSNPFRRLTELQPQSPFPITLVAFRTGGAALEASLHGQFSDERLFGEWFSDIPEIEQVFS